MGFVGEVRPIPYTAAHACLGGGGREGAQGGAGGAAPPPPPPPPPPPLAVSLRVSDAAAQWLTVRGLLQTIDTLRRMDWREVGPETFLLAPLRFCCGTPLSVLLDSRPFARCIATARVLSWLNKWSTSA